MANLMACNCLLSTATVIFTINGFMFVQFDWTFLKWASDECTLSLNVEFEITL